MTKMTWKKFSIIMTGLATINGVLSLMNYALDAADAEDADVESEE